MAGFTRSMRYCDSYLKNQGYVDAILHIMVTTCGCSRIKPLCRDLNVAPIPDAIWPYHFTCKETATAGCKTIAKLVTTIWIKIPTKGDKVCFNFYKEDETLANSCK